MSEEEFLAALTGSDSDLRLALEALRAAYPRVISMVPAGLIPEVDAMRGGES